MPSRYPPNPKYKNLSKKAALQLAAEDTGALVGFLFSREMEDKKARDRITEGYPEAPKYKKGGKFNPKYTRGSSNVGKRKRLMSEISNIYKQHRGTKAKRQKKGFPPSVAARLKQLMKQRDKI
tara:strand:+ start:1604 stop:1972 length:369 start_codon:yes stop_codon:yes gene_type:complete